MSRKTHWTHVQSPVFKPVWLRVLIAGFCLAWAAFEFVSGSAPWGMLFAAAGIYLAYQFFVVWNPEEDEE